jgi:hypothetical protein
MSQDKLTSGYARSIGVTEADAHTARNIHLSVADCRHIKHILEAVARRLSRTRRPSVTR